MITVSLNWIKCLRYDSLVAKSSAIRGGSDAKSLYDLSLDFWLSRLPTFAFLPRFPALPYFCVALERSRHPSGKRCLHKSFIATMRTYDIPTFIHHWKRQTDVRYNTGERSLIIHLVIFGASLSSQTLSFIVMRMFDWIRSLHFTLIYIALHRLSRPIMAATKVRRIDWQFDLSASAISRCSRVSFVRSCVN